MQTGPRRRRTLIGRRFTTAYPDGSAEHRELVGDNPIGVLRGTFGIVLKPEEEARLRSVYESDREDHKNHEDGGLS